ncbi:MAG: hypothetical protein SVX28_07300 [Pseudomonadota bacterium]|nr:hypothetical protein [Pseudomonadota bacterium]
MNEVINSFNSNSETLSSIDLLEMVNGARKEHGENPIRRNDFHARIADELEGEHYETFVVQNPNSTSTSAFSLTQEQCLLVSMRESKAVRRSVVKKLKALAGQQKTPTWLQNLSPQAKVVIEDLNSQVNHYRNESQRLNAVCNDLAANLKNGITPPAFCRMLNGVNVNRVQPLLVERKRLIKTAHGYRSASAYRDKLFTERRELNQEGRLCEKVVLTLKGAKWLYAEYEKGHLDMKKDWDGQFSHLILDQEVAA